MLSSAFLDWWFAPWQYADLGPDCRAADLIGRRDGYRLWCARLGVRPSLPPAFDAVWAELATRDGAEFVSNARLFGGLFAAREQQREALGQLAPEDRKWCMSIASVQPLARLAPWRQVSGEPLEACGLAELQARLEQAFPGMWSRLRLLLPDDLRQRAQALAEAMDGSGLDEVSDRRALRCWRMCRRRVQAALGQRSLDQA